MSLSIYPRQRAAHSTQGKKVQGDVGEASVHQVKVYRQYMNTKKSRPTKPNGAGGS
jgi:hypothetical protein